MIPLACVAARSLMALSENRLHADALSREGFVVVVVEDRPLLLTLLNFILLKEASQNVFRF